MAQTQCELRRYPAVGYNADKGGHEDGDESLNGVEPEYVLSKAVIAEEHAHRNQIGAPYGEFHEVHSGKKEFNTCF